MTAGSDYDDWVTPPATAKGLNGDILLHYPPAQGL
jgi:asparagine synthetase A